MRGQKAPAGGEFALTLPYHRAKKPLKNDTKSPCIFTRKCHKAGVWVIENFLTRSFSLPYYGDFVYRKAIYFSP